MAIKQKDYLAIAKGKVTKPSQRPFHPKILAYSRNKKGKSTFGISAGIAKTLVLDPEDGTDLMLEKDPYIWPISQWADMQDAYGALRTGKLSPFTLGVGPEKEVFEYVSVDGLTRMSNMALRYIRSVAEERDLDRKPGLTKRQDYGQSGELVKQMLNNFHSLPMGVIFTAQERMITGGTGDDDEDEDAAYFVPDLPAGVRGAVNSVVQVIARLYVVRVELKKGGTIAQRRLQIGPHERYDTGYRSDFVLPDMLKNPTIPKLVELMRTGQVPSRG